MKKYLFVLVATMLALVGCTDQQFLEDGLANNVPPAAEIGTKTGSKMAAILSPMRQQAPVVGKRHTATSNPGWRA